jgi:hypothetical protein
MIGVVRFAHHRQGELGGLLMRIHPLSFVLGLGTAAVIPMVSRVVRPLAVEAAAAGIGLFEDARRVLAEQMEMLEDIAAEARARRAEIVAAQNGHVDLGVEETAEAAAETAAAAPPRRARGGSRRRVS